MPIPEISIFCSGIDLLVLWLTFQLRQEIEDPLLSNVPTSAGEIKSISKSNEKNVNGNGNSPGGRTREKLGVVKFRVICYTKNFDIEYIAKLYNTNFSVH